MTTIVLAGAGTAGHVEPALAVARELRKRDPDISLKFIGTKDGLENTLVPAAGFELSLINKAPFPRSLNLTALKWPFKFYGTLNATRKIVQGSDLVIGFGGYVAAPAYIAARKARIPIYAHEANAKMGLANRLAKKSGATVLRGLPEVGTSASGHDDIVGLPLRESIVDLARKSGDEREQLRRDAIESYGLDPKLPMLLVFGGSLGSVAFNKTISASLEQLLKSGVQIIHAVGSKNDLPQSRAGYLPLHYLDQMANAYAASDLVISRAGAVTVAETGVLGIYTVYVPLPIGNGEQAFNARVVCQHGGGQIVTNEEFTSQWLISNIAELIQKSRLWKAQGDPLSLPLNAAEVIADRALQEVAR